jgi:hypothetical protein
MNLARAAQDRRMAVRAIAATLILLSAGNAADATPPAPIVLSVSAPTSVKSGGSRDVSVTMTNVGTTPVLVLPNVLRLRIEGAGAEYVPYPGPPIDPWDGARELAPGLHATVLFRDTSDKRGIWRLPRGSFSITAVYEVTPDLAPPSRIAGAGRLWRGRVQSSPVTMVVD